MKGPESPVPETPNSSSKLCFESLISFVPSPTSLHVPHFPSSAIAYSYILPLSYSETSCIPIACTGDRKLHSLLFLHWPGSKTSVILHTVVLPCELSGGYLLSSSVRDLPRHAAVHTARPTPSHSWRPSWALLAIAHPGPWLGWS